MHGATIITSNGLCHFVNYSHFEALCFNVVLYTYILLVSCGCFVMWRSWLRHCATSREVPCSIPDGGTGFFKVI